jgi:chaperone modulatory protein CbpM
MTPSTMVHSPLAHVSFEELCHCAPIAAEHLLQLIELQIVLPITGQQMHEWFFTATCVSTVKKVVRLHENLDLDWSAIAVIMDLIAQRDQLKKENAELRQRLQRFFRDDF